MTGPPGLPGYAFARREVPVGGFRMNVVDDGPRDAHAVVMLHGNPTWSYFYRGLIGALRGEHRCIAPDHIGMGLSEKPSADRYDFTLARRVADLEEALEKLDAPREVSLVLHDWGGMIGMAWAVRHPERVRRIVVLNTAAFALPEGKRFPWQLALCRVPGVGALLVRGLNLFVRGTASTGVVRRPLPADVLAAYLAPYGSWSERLAVLRFVEDIPLRPADRAYPVLRETEEGLARLEQKPMLICWGLRDFVFDAAFLDGWIRRFPRAEVHRFEEAGHYVLEDAGEEIAALVKTFLRAG